MIFEIVSDKNDHGYFFRIGIHHAKDQLSGGKPRIQRSSMFSNKSIERALTGD